VWRFTFLAATPKGRCVFLECFCGHNCMRGTVAGCKISAAVINTATGY
jgi:hypothetical protein